ncbi:MAG: peptidylprolyl isomerase [Gammaproteobacteria bacterium]|nr:peptidylprolyl isomerase [Gammaproteobacteria bacterium]
MSKIACASHILLKTEIEALRAKARLEQGENFAKLAKALSRCPSANKGGDLGEFRKGAMLPAFDKAVFASDSEDKKFIGPVKTKAGFHLIQVLYKL